MNSLLNDSLSNVLDLISSSEPVPGGGSASSISGLIGISLVLMSINVTRRSSSSNILDTAAASLEKDIIDLKVLMENDITAFSQYMTALRLPKNTIELESTRKSSLIDATIYAIDVPIAAAQLLSKSLNISKEVAPHIKTSVISDTIAGCELIKSAAISILLNVDVNLKSKLISEKMEYYKNTKNNILKEINNNFENIMNLGTDNGFILSL